MYFECSHSIAERYDSYYGHTVYFDGICDDRLGRSRSGPTPGSATTITVVTVLHTQAYKP